MMETADMERKEESSMLYCTWIHASKPLTEYKLIGRSYVHAGHRETHLLPHLSLDLFVDPDRSPLHSLSPATQKQINNKSMISQCVLNKGLIIITDGCFIMLITGC